MTTHGYTIAGYLTLLALAFIIWFATRDGRHKRFTSLGRMFRGILSYRGTRMGLIIFWWWLGWHFLVSVVHYK